MIKDITGRVFGRLTAIKRYDIDNNIYSLWLCQCDCGNEKITSRQNLIKGNTRSCGCLKIEKLKQRSITHGESKTKLYRCWCSMIGRCISVNTKPYKDYGGRGITICDEWKNDFMLFKKWAEENGYQEHLTIDRIDNNGNYCPLNCKWSTRKEQQNNRRNNVLITYQNETKTVKQWAEQTGINKSTIVGRLKNTTDPEIILFKGDKRWK